MNSPLRYRLTGLRSKTKKAPSQKRESRCPLRRHQRIRISRTAHWLQPRAVRAQYRVSVTKYTRVYLSCESIS